MAHHEVLFSEEISLGSSGGPGYMTLMAEQDSGQIHTVSRWANARRRYNIAWGIKTPKELAEVQRFFIARGGGAATFNFRDWLDYTSNNEDPSYQLTGGLPYTALGNKDQQIGVGDGTKVQFQLVKRYTSGPVTKTRVIRKPRQGTVRVWLDDEEQLSGWTVDVTTGIVTFDNAPPPGVVITASFEFDVVVRFAEGTDRLFDSTIESYGHGNAGPIELIEDIDPETGNVGEYFYGGSYETVSASNLTISFGLGRAWHLAFSTTGRTAFLENPAKIPTGGPIGYIYNDGANPFTLKDHNGTTLAVLDAGQMVEITLAVDETDTKVYYAA